MRVLIRPSHAQGVIAAQPSKSMLHRALICACLSKDASILSGYADSEDILATSDCAGALGAQITVREQDVFVSGGTLPEQPVQLNCRESGSTMRFFMGIAMGLGIKAFFYGSRTLLNRPFGIYEKICSRQGIAFQREADHILIDGKLKPGDFEIEGNVSSQFISGLLFVLPLLEKDSTIRLIPPVESKSYIDLTVQMLSRFGVRVSWTDENTLLIPGKQAYQGTTLTVEGDYSNAAFLEALSEPAGRVIVKGLDQKSLQGDRVYRQHFESLREGEATIDLSDCPDLGPVLMAFCAMNHGALFTGTSRLKLKESDRGEAMCSELSKCGIRTEKKENSIRVFAGGLHEPGVPLYGHNDHRIVMALSVLLTRCGGSIDGAEAVRKSYPAFFEDLQHLGVDLELIREEGGEDLANDS